MPAPIENLVSGLSVRFGKMLKAGPMPAWALEKFTGGVRVFCILIPAGMDERAERIYRVNVCKTMNTGQIFNAIG